MEQENRFAQKIDSIGRKDQDKNYSNETKKQEHHDKKIGNEVNEQKDNEKHIKMEEQKEKKEHKHTERKTLGRMDIKEASEVAMEELAEATGKKAESTVSISKEGENWQATIEIIDEEYLPGQNLKSMSDIIGVYEVTLESSGKLINWTKKNSRRRGNVSVS
jgi:hypothetical protein